MVTTDVTVLYLSIHYDIGPKALREELNKRRQKRTRSTELAKMAYFVLKIDFFESDCQIKQQISGIAIEIRCSPAYACMFIDKMKGEFLENQEYKPFTWRYIGNIFFIWALYLLYFLGGDERFKTSMENHNLFHSNIKFTHESSKESIPFLDFNVNFSQGNLRLITYRSSHQYLPSILGIPSNQ